MNTSKTTKDKVLEIRRLLATLPKSEIKKVVDYALSLNLGKTTTRNRNHEILYDEIVSEVKKRTLKDSPGFFVFNTTPAYPKFQKGVEVIDQFLTGTLKSVETPRRKKAYNILVSICCDRLMSIDVPVSVKTVVNLLEDAPGLFDFAFPGYAASGLIDRVL